MATAVKNPKNVTIRGRVSFPVWTYNEAIERNKTSKFPENDPAKIKPEFNLLVEEGQLDKLTDHILNVFLPYCAEQYKKGEKERDAMEPKVIKRIADLIKSGDWEAQPPFLPIKKISEKNAENAPECVASIKVAGPRGADFDLRATVYEEGQLLVPDADILSYPVQKKLGETVFQMYPGAYAITTLNLFSFFSSNAIFGVSAGANVAFYMGNLEGERFGGGSDIDEDEIFAD